MIALIIPCFNESRRLDATAFTSASSEELKFLFVDDGSTDGSYDFLLKSFEGNPHCRVIRMKQNVGKGEAIRTAALELAKMDWWKNLKWFGFWDADLATPLTEVPHFLKFAELYQDVDSIWGSRVYRLGSEIKRSALRHYLGRGFATLVHQLLHVEAYDTQCGAKLFKKDLLESGFSHPFLSRWIFDIEILLRLERKNIIEYPLTQWQDIPGSKLKVSREILRVFRDILRIRKKYILRLERQS